MKDIEDRRLFDAKNVEFLAPYLMEALKKASPQQVVVVSYFTREAKSVVMEDRLTVFRAFVKEDGLHFRFKKLYAKLLGDRTTKGLERSMQEAKGIRVQLEPQPGVALVSHKPVEVIFDLPYFLKGTSAVPAEASPGKKPILLHTHDTLGKGDEGRPIRERLKELDRLREEELITEKEYQRKRRELLEEL